jgi:biotin-dependent carboxylase-like uncharacterized protein
MRIFRVINAGLFTTVQDLGRYGYLQYGVPISGAMDTFSLTVANLLVANDERDACLETTLVGPKLQALTTAQIAITGGNCSPNVNGHQVAMWQTLTLQEGDVVSFGRMENGCRAYLSVRGGINVPLLLGSRSTYVRGGFGGLEGRQLKTEDVIEASNMSLLSVEYSLPTKHVLQFRNQLTAHVVLGPQDDMFTEKGLNAFLSNPYKIISEADRMGYRLEGSVIEHVSKADIVSDAILPGAVQVPRDGKPILIMRDAQTTGGYPKIAVVVTADVDLLGQAKPGDVIEFSKVTVKEAQEKTHVYYRLLKALRGALERKSL